MISRGKKAIQRQIDELHDRAEEHRGRANSYTYAGLHKKAAYHNEESSRLVLQAKRLRDQL